ncbi:MAG: nuclear transport factor 2 family protein [Phycisphaerae bacterium]|nr:nuclear transport factor 2 family protein [Phycisphaerae bacterium]
MRTALSVAIVAASAVQVACSPRTGVVQVQRSATLSDEAGAAGDVARTLDALHESAAKADEARYFSLFAPGGIFLGTDDSERWTVDEFRAYAHPFFSQGKGWTYTVAERFVSFSPDGKTAWFDERLDNAKWGRCRGSGVLTKFGKRWRIEQYNLLVPIPNDLLPEVAARIREFEATHATDR